MRCFDLEKQKHYLQEQLTEWPGCNGTATWDKNMDIFRFRIYCLQESFRGNLQVRYTKYHQYLIPVVSW